MNGVISPGDNPQITPATAMVDGAVAELAQDKETGVVTAEIRIPGPAVP